VYQDIEGVSRPQERSFDLGAYEYVGGGVPTTSTPTSVPVSSRTNTPVATATRTRTNTPVPPSGTPLATGTNTPVPPTSTPLSGATRLDTGTDASHVDSSGNRWVGDMGYIGGQIIARSAIAIANTNDPWIYQTERYGMSVYAL